MLARAVALSLSLGTLAMTGSSPDATAEPPHPAPRGILFETITIDGVEMPCAVYIPSDLPADPPAPAILFLHGSGECGTDGTRQLTVGLPPAILAEPGRWPFVVLMPQKPEGLAEWEDYEAHLLALLDRAPGRYGVDPARIAITGLSQGGHGAITLAARHPDRFRAVAPVCGYVGRRIVDGQRGPVAEPTLESPEVLDAAASLAALPVWLFHGERDDVVLPAESRVLHAALEQRGAQATLTIFPDDNHNAWDSAYRRTDLHTWLAEHTAPE